MLRDPGNTARLKPREAGTKEGGLGTRTREHRIIQISENLDQTPRSELGSSDCSAAGRQWQRNVRSYWNNGAEFLRINGLDRVCQILNNFRL